MRASPHTRFGASLISIPAMWLILAALLVGCAAVWGQEAGRALSMLREAL